MRICKVSSSADSKKAVFTHLPCHFDNGQFGRTVIKVLVLVQLRIPQHVNTKSERRRVTAMNTVSRIALRRNQFMHGI
jgi:hypothetical protein